MPGTESTSGVALDLNEESTSLHSPWALEPASSFSTWMPFGRSRFGSETSAEPCEPGGNRFDFLDLPDASAIARAPAIGPGERILRRLPGWMFSVAIHGLVLIVFGSTFFSGSGQRVGGGGRGGDEGSGVGVIEGSWGHSENAGGPLVESVSRAAAPHFDSEVGPAGLTEIPELEAPPVLFRNAASRSRIHTASASAEPLDTRNGEGAGSSRGGGAGRGAGESDAFGDGGDGAGSGIVRFFGLSDRGISVVYAVDSSSSMEGHGAFRVARSELASSLQRLAPRNRFHVLFYNSRIQEMPADEDDESPLRFATLPHLLQARQFISGVLPDLGTEHLPALRRGLRLRPDALFLLTDAADPPLSDRELADLRRMNGGRTRIHCIEFGKGGRAAERENFLKKLARQNGGTYRYCDVTRF